MTEHQPANIAREAKGIHESLKELLKTKEPFDREVDFQRKNLRRRYLNLLLIHPRAKESKDVENHLWMQTSYAFIASYKQRILNLDRIIQGKIRQPQPNSRPNSHVVEHRKLVQRFRQFLADEEKFWTQLVVRLRRSFVLDEATPALVTLKIISETEETVSHPSEVPEAINTPPNGRNHFQFPPEDASTSFIATTSEERDGWLAIMTKTLICLGDIARYRELYNEAGGRPKAGHEEGLARRGRNRRGDQTTIDSIPRPRNYERAQNCYEQAKLLVPSDGNPSHQLAIIATYRKDSFLSLTHYYRALCVRTPYDTASENLGSVLSKTLEQWRNRSKRERERVDILPPRVQIELFKEKVVVLHALWKVGIEKGIEKMNTLSRRHHHGVLNDFLALVSERHLPTDMISNAIILSQGALWKHRMVRNGSNPARSRKPEAPTPPEGTSVILERHILEQLLELHRALLEVGADELKVPPPRDAPRDDLAQRITGTFRRTLPALRIASKWLRANIAYMLKDHEFEAYQRTEPDNGHEVIRNSEYQISWVSLKTRFWRAYVDFVSALWRVFPPSKLPPLTAPLEEDIEMRGFLPLKRMMGETKTEKPTTIPPQTQETHPNDWQLMRIADLLNDAKELTMVASSPISESSGQFCFIAEVVELSEFSHRKYKESFPAHERNPLSPTQDTHLDIGAVREREDDAMTETTSRTDDEVLRDAFQFLHTAIEEDEVEEDEIVWDLGAPVLPPSPPSLPSPTSHATPMTYTQPMKSPVRMSPTHSKIIPPANVPPTTAQDLLNDVMGGRVALPHLESSAPQPALLFGSELPHRQGHNIWSASQEEQSLKFTSQPNHMYQPKQFQNSNVPEPSQSMWASSYPNETQNSQHDFTGGLLPTTFPHLPQSTAPGVHRRVPSAPMGVSQHFPNYHGGLQDPSVYPQSPPQQPMHRLDTHDLLTTTYMNSPQLPNSGIGMYYQNTPIPNSRYHSHHFSMNDPRLTQPFVPPSLWGNAG